MAFPLAFDALTHVYTRIADGREIDGVTRILRAVGISADFERIARSSMRRSDQMAAARALGTTVHALTHAYDADDLVVESVRDDYRPWLDAWRLFRAHYQLRPIAREVLVFHPVHCYAGTLDGLFADPNDRIILLDIKTGDPESAGTRYQLAAYEAAQTIVPKVHERWAVQLDPDLTVPYRVHPYTDPSDFKYFLCFLTTYRHQLARRDAA
jgi:hypothetical protein